jgi:hypothetical protein
MRRRLAHSDRGRFYAAIASTQPFLGNPEKPPCSWDNDRVLMVHFRVGLLQFRGTGARLGQMGYLVGTDEAGYGPNLGPLIISTTVWETPDDVGNEDLFHRLRYAIASRLDQVSAAAGPWVAMADSKLLYTPGKGLRHLERGLWAAFGLLGCRPQTWREVWQTLAPEALVQMPLMPWHADYDGAAPLDYLAEELELLVESLRAGLAAAGVRLLAVRSRAIFAEEFNELVERHGSKGAALSHETLALAARAIEALPAGPISVICDKHGGRNCYQRLLAAHFPEWLVEVHGEGRQRSLYRFGPPERRVDACFRVKGESCLTAALASMASKYLRELAMRAMNDFWCRRVPGLRPTAGYPGDAPRFRRDIARAQAELQIADRILWRER